MNDAVNVTARDAVHAGIQLGLGQTRSLEIWRSLGGQMRDIDWAELWTTEWAAFRAWRSQTHK